MRTADLDNIIPLFGLGRQQFLPALQSGEQLLLNRLPNGHVDRRGKHVVGRLPHVDVVVGVNGLFLVKAIAAGQLDRPVTDDLIGVHVG